MLTPARSATCPIFIPHLLTLDSTPDFIVESMTDETSAATPPIVCDMTTGTDTAAERFADYQLLFATALTGRERTDDGIRFRFRAAPGLEDRVRDLAAREKACCAF